MNRPDTITIEHPDTEGALMIINAEDFDPELHKPWSGETPSTPADPGHSRGNTGGSEGDPLPAGYEVKHIAGGRYRAFVDGKPLIDSGTEKEAMFMGKDAAIAALREYEAAVKAAEDAPPADPAAQ